MVWVKVNSPRLLCSLALPLILWIGAVSCVRADPIEYYKIQDIQRFGDWVAYKHMASELAPENCWPTTEFLVGHSLVEMTLLSHKHNDGYEFWFDIYDRFLTDHQFYLDGEYLSDGSDEYFYTSIEQLDSIARGKVFEVQATEHSRLKSDIDNNWGDATVAANIRQEISLNGYWEALRYCGFFG